MARFRIWWSFGRSLSITFVGFLLVSAAHTQVAPGIPTFSTWAGGTAYEDVNVSNRNIFVNIPIRTKLGAVPFQYRLNGNSNVQVNGANYWIPTFGLGGSASWDGTITHATHTGQDCPDGIHKAIVYDTWTFIDQSGAVHSFPNAFVDTLRCITSTYTDVASDNSSFTLVVTCSGTNLFTITIYDGGGNTIIPGSSFTDPNGNQTTVSSASPFVYTDTLGQTALTRTPGVSGSPDTYTYSDAAGNIQPFKVSYTSSTVKTNFGCTGLNETNLTPYLPTSVSFPDGSSFTITYEPTPGISGAVTGRVQTITFPQGGNVTYMYSGGHNGIDCTSRAVPILTRTVTNSDGIQSVWKYDATAISGSVVVTDPSGNETVLQFSNPSGESNAGIETQRKVYTGSHSSGTLLNTVVTCYNGNSTNCATANVSTPITEIDGYNTPAGSSSSSISKTFFDAYGNVTETKAYDFGGSSPIVDTTITYALSGSGSCSIIGAHIKNRPCSIVAKDSSGSIVAQTNNSYDANGNRLSSSPLVSGSTYLTSSATYNANGTVNVATDVNGAQTTYSYNGTGGCNNLLPTGISEPLSLSRSMTWDCNGGVVTSTTDVNGKTTQYSYLNQQGTAADQFWRVLYIRDPLQNVTNFTYTPASGGNPGKEESVLTFGSSISETLKTFDGLGRLHVVQHRQGPSSTNYDSVETDYDANGRVSRVTLPYSGAKSATNSTIVSTTYVYDALDRPLTVKDPAGATLTLQYTGRDVLRTVGPASSGDGTFSSQMEYDGLGRLTSVCEVTGGTSAWPGGACGQVQQQARTGYLTTYAYNPLGYLTTVTQNAQSSATQTRSFSLDGLGRLNSELNPETGQNAPGTTTYTFDADSSGTCAGPFNGDLVKRVDNAGDVTCYAYDALHRVTSITYPSGPKASSTKKKTFVYDATTFSCPNGANIAGRLAKAFTGSTSVSIGYCYSPRGEITDVYQSTPNSGGYAHFSVSYWPNGQLDVLSGLPSSLPSFTYGLDGEGRYKTVSASSGQNPVTATGYNPAQQLTSITFGSGDNDVYSINSGRMTRYTYNVNGSAVFGTLNWNTNGTLKSLGITDPLNGANAQTCTYHYDDLVRASSAGCGTTWSQTFMDDPFGNITKSGSSSWMPGYSTSTNHYTLTGTSYDANGNLTNDTFNTYAWDAEGKMITLNSGTTSTTNTFDAFGRIAETGPSGGPWTQFVYLPGNDKVFAAMSNATTLQKAFIPLPDGGQAVYNGSTLAYYRHPDWLGSSRMATTPSRTVYFDGGYAPFGESYATTGATDLMFAGHTQDVIAGGLYDSLNRKYHTAQGRWISPDPAGLSAVDLGNPQTLNRYGYVMNNPLSYIDPLGLACYPLELKMYHRCPVPLPAFGASWNVFNLFWGWDWCENGDCRRFTIGNGLAFALGWQGPGNNEVEKKQLQKLSACVNQIYHINLRTFVPVAPGSNGYFYGLTATGA